MDAKHDGKGVVSPKNGGAMMAAAASTYTCEQAKNMIKQIQIEKVQSEIYQMASKMMNIEGANSA